MSIYQEIEDVVVKTFGLDLADWLLENDKIVPTELVLKQDGSYGKPPAIELMKRSGVTTKLTEFTTADLRMLVEMPVGLGVKGNDRFQVVDVDVKDLNIGIPNMETTKGEHYWIEPHFESNQNIYFDNKHVGEIFCNPNTYVVFYGQGKSPVLEELNTWTNLEGRGLTTKSDPLPEYSNEIKCQDEVRRSSVEIQQQDIELRYREEIKSGGNYQEYVQDRYQVKLDLSGIERSYVGQMKNCTSGRNITLHRLALEYYRLGIPTTSLEQAAATAGLGAYEIDSCIGGAESRFDTDVGLSVADRCDVWMEAFNQYQWTAKQLWIGTELRDLAIIKNSLNPQFNQQTFAEKSGINRGYIRDTLNTNFKNKGLLIVDKPKEKRPDGKDYPNNYYLSINSSVLTKIVA